MGLNQNHGMKILLRLRTDDLQGFRKVCVVRCGWWSLGDTHSFFCSGKVQRRVPASCAFYFVRRGSARDWAVSATLPLSTSCNSSLKPTDYLEYNMLRPRPSHHGEGHVTIFADVQRAICRTPTRKSCARLQTTFFVSFRFSCQPCLRRFVLDEQILSIRKVLFHELAHNEFSDHDDNFYMLMRQVRYAARGVDKKSLSECQASSHPFKRRVPNGVLLTPAALEG